MGTTSTAGEDQAAVESSRQPDEVVFVALHAPLRRFASTVAPSHSDPDDLVQEAVARTIARRTARAPGRSAPVLAARRPPTRRAWSAATNGPLRAGDRVLLPLTLPDGRRYELSYPQGVDVAALGVRFFAQVDWSVTAQGANGPPMQCCDREFMLSYTTIADLYPDAEAIASYPGADGSSVLLFHAAQRRTTPGPDTTGDYLVFQFGPWVAEVWASVPGTTYGQITPLDEEQRATWASRLRAGVDPKGFLVLHPQAPLKLADPKLVQVLFGGMSTTGLTLWQFACGESGSDTDLRRSSGSVGAESGIAWCDPVTGLHVGASGPTDMTEAIGSGLELRALPTR